MKKVVDMRKIKKTASAVRAETRLRGELGRFLLSAGSEKGQALVEFALVLPVLLLVVTGITTFGIALNNYLQLTEAVGIGGQALSVSRGNTTDPCNTVSSAVEGASSLTSSSLSFTTKIYTSSSSSTSYSGASCSSTSTTTGAAGNLTQGQAAVVTVTYPCSLAVYNFNIAPTCNLTAQVTEIIQ